MRNGGKGRKSFFVTPDNSNQILPFPYSIKRSSVADLRGGGAPGTRPPGSKFFHFYAVFGRKNRLAHPLWELRAPPGENPGSATGLSTSHDRKTDILLRTWFLFPQSFIIFTFSLLERHMWHNSICRNTIIVWKAFLLLWYDVKVCLLENYLYIFLQIFRSRGENSSQRQFSRWEFSNESQTWGS